MNDYSFTIVRDYFGHPITAHIGDPTVTVQPEQWPADTDRRTPDDQTKREQTIWQDGYEAGVTRGCANSGVATQRRIRDLEQDIMSLNDRFLEAQLQLRVERETSRRLRESVLRLRRELDG